MLEFIGDLGSRLADRPQITTDGLASYVTAIDEIVGIDVDFAQLIKTCTKRLTLARSGNTAQVSALALSAAK